MPPLGWFYAQGLFPLTSDSSDDDEGPCQLPNGRMVCGRHGFVTCGKCCVDFSFMDDLSDNEVEDDPNAMRIRRGTGRVFPTKFIPRSSTASPSQVFLSLRTPTITRYVHREDPNTVLLFTDGACLNNGRPNPKAGWAVNYGPGHEGGRADVKSGRLEKEGPFGDRSIQTSNRAELRAVIAALRLCHWPEEGFNTVIIATDSEYVTNGSTVWARGWMRNGWQTSDHQAVQNKDLWEALLGEVERWNDRRVAVQFWKIPRDCNEVADEAAKRAAGGAEAPVAFKDLFNVL